MREHYCEEHETAYRKYTKGDKYWYSHKIEGTDNWCNEPKTEQKEEKEEKPEPKQRSTDTSSSIEQQVAFKGLIELTVAKVIDTEGREYQTAINYAMSKLSNWASMGQPPPDRIVFVSTEQLPVQADVKVEMIDKAQANRIVELKKEKDYSNELLIAIITRFYGKTSSTKLIKREADELIAMMEKGMHKGKTAREVAGAEVPF